MIINNIVEPESGVTKLDSTVDNIEQYGKHNVVQCSQSDHRLSNLLHKSTRHCSAQELSVPFVMSLVSTLKKGSHLFPRTILKMASCKGKLNYVTNSNGSTYAKNREVILLRIIFYGALKYCLLCF